MSDSLWPYESQHARPPGPSPTPRVHSGSHPSSQSCHPAISFSVISFSSRLQFFLSIKWIRVFSNELGLRIRWLKYWSFSFRISPSNEYSELIFFKMDWLDLLAVQGTLKSLLQHHSSKASISFYAWAIATVHPLIKINQGWLWRENLKVESQAESSCPGFLWWAALGHVLGVMILPSYHWPWEVLLPF